jgi:hypothetical protein
MWGIMPRFKTNQITYATVRGVTLLLAAAVLAIMLSGCGGTSSHSDPQSATLSGNWQFSMDPQTDGVTGDPVFSGGLQGGFLLQNNNTATGQTVYSITSSASVTGPCNSGSAPVSVMISGSNVTITEVAGTQSFTLTGTLSSDGTTMMGTYTSTAGTAADGSVCGYAESGLNWHAVSEPPLTGSITGSFHSTGVGSSLTNQDFAVTGFFTQGQNIGASNATITGTLSFIDPVSNASDYPCFSTASVNGQISGNSVILQVIATNGSVVGQLGEPPSLFSSTGVNPVTFDSVQGGYVLHGAEPTYMVASKSCPGSLEDTTVAGDSGNICLALNNINACQQPITLSPAAITFPAQALNAASTTQTITLANDSSSTLSDLTLSFVDIVGTSFNGQSDFNALPNFTETDACGAGGAPSQGNPFNLGSGQSCSITLTFAPQESCPWLPFPAPPSISGAPPQYCPFSLGAMLTVLSPESADSDKSFSVPITGVGVSALQPSTPELDFSAEEQFAPKEASLPQSLSFINTSANPVQILGSVPCVNPAHLGSSLTLPAPRQASPVAGLQVLGNGQGSNFSISPDVTTIPETIQYNCDSDPGTLLPNFQISSDTCTGNTIAPQASCSLQVSYVPQPTTHIDSGLDFFLELNTLQCWPAGTLPSPSNPCEIDSGRFPVELKANAPSPLRMSPAAGLDFGTQKKGTSSAPQTITLRNDPNLANPLTVNFLGKIAVSGSYVESDDCPATLAPSGSCTLTVTFNPGGTGFSPGSLTINYTQQASGGAVTTGNPQEVYLRGTGQ